MPRSVWVGTGEVMSQVHGLIWQKRTGSREKVGETGLSQLTVCLLAVPGRPRLREAIPLLTTNLFSGAPPACTEVKRRRAGGEEKKIMTGYSTFQAGFHKSASQGGGWRMERERERERGWDVLDMHVLREGRQEAGREKKTNRPREERTHISIPVTQVDRIWNSLHYGKTKNNNWIMADNWLWLGT